jgi:hypothetical protein
MHWGESIQNNGFRRFTLSFSSDASNKVAFDAYCSRSLKLQVTEFGVKFHCTLIRFFDAEPVGQFVGEVFYPK